MKYVIIITALLFSINANSQFVNGLKRFQAKYYQINLSGMTDSLFHVQNVSGDTSFAVRSYNVLTMYSDGRLIVKDSAKAIIVLLNAINLMSNRVEFPPRDLKKLPPGVEWIPTAKP